MPLSPEKHLCYPTFNGIKEEKEIEGNTGITVLFQLQIAIPDSFL